MPNLFSPDDLNQGYLLNQAYEDLIFTEVKDLGLIEITEGLSILIAHNKDYTYIKLQNTENQPLCILRLKQIIIQEQKYYSVDKSHSFVKGKGFAVPLYKYAFCYFDLPVVSDEYQTMPGSSRLWKKFQKRQDKLEYEIYVFNTQTNNQGIFLTRNYNDYDIWGWPKDQILTLNQAPDFIENLTNIENFDEESVTLFPSYELEEEIQDILETNFIYKSSMHPKLENFLILGEKRLKDRKHILLMGRKKQEKT